MTDFSEFDDGYNDSDASPCPRCGSRQTVVDVHGYPGAPPERLDWFEAGVDVHGTWYFAEELPTAIGDDEEDDFEIEYSYTTLSGEPVVPVGYVEVRSFIGTRQGVWWHLAGCVMEYPDGEFPNQCRSCGHVWADEPYVDEEI